MFVSNGVQTINESVRRDGIEKSCIHAGIECTRQAIGAALVANRYDEGQWIQRANAFENEIMLLSNSDYK
ncbi:hypothetical protein MTX20_28755 [Bradyrhizobium sp. ISRA435]|nr:hypothetical protein MTX20_28755 [Bradyrhizobium sp. ISRA435]